MAAPAATETPTTLTTLISRLTEARHAQNLSITAISDTLGITPMAVGHWEHGHNYPLVDNFILWAWTLGFTTTITDNASGATLAPPRLPPRRNEPPELYELRRITLVLRSIRLEADLTQATLGKQLAVSAWTVQMWENARRVPRVNHLVQWCAALDCHLELGH